ncbi:DNA polymerase IV [Paraliobacillus ryukyuensis]|uniref:DNA polymerase IV n=1 Tax=Paraliobacillus ryukyuensis TaxID=200904 RepID=A0A366E9N9_9BACI|nr:DNA polymerase IV [Paraliobacillus ryukyuensis]RBO98128.1 DNA polymerase-4/DNA polymerase V [Paraliobacillus ryukyuensis]
MEKVIFLVDMQSFYASVEKASNSALADKPVIVSGDPEQRSGIILAACPIAKQQGVKTAEPLWEAQIKCPDAVVVRPRMQLYIDVSYQITKLLEQFSDLVEPYSIDEQFLDITASQHLFGTSVQMAEKIQQAILEDMGTHARIGIGPNKVLAKMACDVYAKKNSKGIFQLDESNLESKLWQLPISKLFGVGSRMEKHLIHMGLHTIGNVANYPLRLLKKRWGINGEVLWRTANGIDYSPVTINTHQEQKAIGHHMTLPQDYYSWEDIKVVLLELSEEVARRARRQQYCGKRISIATKGVDFDLPTGFHRQQKIATATHFGMDIYRVAALLFQKFWDGSPVRGVGITLGQLERAETYQLSLFDQVEEKETLSKAIDRMYDKYGPTAIVRASSLMPSGQVHVRSKKIGGHYK